MRAHPTKRKGQSRIAFGGCSFCAPRRINGWWSQRRLSVWVHRLSAPPQEWRAKLGARDAPRRRPSRDRAEAPPPPRHAVTSTAAAGRERLETAHTAILPVPGLVCGARGLGAQPSAVDRA